MALQQVELEPIQRGDTKSFAFSFSNGVDPIDMRGKTLVMSVKIAAIQEDADAVFTKTFTPDAGDAQAEIGLITLTFEHSETSLLIPTVTYTFSVRVIEPAVPEDVETTYFWGTFLAEDS